MAIAVNPVVIKKLLLVKQLYQQALSISKIRHSEVSRITAVVIFDLSVETLLKAIVAAVDPMKEDKIANSFQSLVDQADAVLVKAGLGELPDKIQIRHTHAFRNDAQHKASYPTETEITECGTYTKTFLQNASLQIWGLNLEKLSMLDVIQHSEIKAHLEIAQNAFANKEYAKSLAYVQVGLNWAIDSASKAFVRYERSSFSDGPVEKEIGKAAMDYIGEIKSLAVLYALGITPAEYFRYQQAANCVLTFNYGGRKIDSMVSTSLPPTEEIEFAVSYAVNTVAQIESFVGDIEMPFGYESPTKLYARMAKEAEERSKKE